MARRSASVSSGVTCENPGSAGAAAAGKSPTTSWQSADLRWFPVKPLCVGLPAAHKKDLSIDFHPPAKVSIIFLLNLKSVTAHCFLYCTRKTNKSRIIIEDTVFLLGKKNKIKVRV